MRKTLALFILPGQPNQAVNQGTGWRSGAEMRRHMSGRRRKEGGGVGGRMALCLSWISY